MAMADDAMAYMWQLGEIQPRQPFSVCYHAPGAIHAPHHPKPEWIERFKSRFRGGPDALAPGKHLLEFDSSTTAAASARAATAWTRRRSSGGMPDRKIRQGFAAGTGG